jgi:hypothetical protein
MEVSLPEGERLPAWIKFSGPGTGAMGNRELACENRPNQKDATFLPLDR